MYDLVIIAFYIMFFIIGLWRRSLITIVFNIINTLAFYSEYGNLTITMIMIFGLVAQTLLIIGGRD